MDNIPDNWGSLDDFVKWYVDNNMPHIPDANMFALETDDAISMTVFRKGRYQVELYFMKANRYVPFHSHPDVDTAIVIKDPSCEFDASNIQITPSTKLHGGDSFMCRSKNMVLISMQKWGEDIPVTSVAIHWCGYTAGDVHDALISKYYPEAIVKKGYADVRRVKSIYGDL
jgi:hypothetical protein